MLAAVDPGASADYACARIGHRFGANSEGYAGRSKWSSCSISIAWFVLPVYFDPTLAVCENLCCGLRYFH